MSTPRHETPKHDGPPRLADERGFTLVELLVVVIIIGILAAIAIPSFLAQRDQAAEKAAVSDLRNGASAALSCAADNTPSGSFVGCDDAKLINVYNWKKTDGVVSQVTTATTAQWVATARHEKDSDSTVFTFDTNEKFDP